MSSKHTRPWYISDKACEEYRQTLSDDDDRGTDLKMLKTLKLVRSIIVNVGIISLGWLSIVNGGAPTIIGFVALAIIGGYNGLEFSDYLALIRAYHEVQDGDSDDTE